jgi:hypothetical protein
VVYSPNALNELNFALFWQVVCQMNIHVQLYIFLRSFPSNSLGTGWAKKQSQATDSLNAMSCAFLAPLPRLLRAKARISVFFEATPATPPPHPSPHLPAH